MGRFRKLAGNEFQTVGAMKLRQQSPTDLRLRFAVLIIQDIIPIFNMRVAFFFFFFHDKTAESRLCYATINVTVHS